MDNNQKEKKPMMRLTALWEKTLPNGTKILSGPLGDLTITIWPNKFKTTDTAPDYHVTVESRFKKTGEAAKYAPGINNKEQGNAPDFFSQEPVPF